ncbi:hypothetical protein T4B_10094 [Trichinella pseudospiralis]|uniref:Uncharacterized protein n=1 Tax=Trichinella pseudospiralis TaxID=6337 RepID=A0A0V1IG36_TRIPS|nr:hypothetical protein T4A_8638 [Trichinella pseudospiralis]KRZ21632.1 hypothetical protein T4B_10094 [Trichinella pseudospiralis]KRZ27587.1 hypothetical protein T4C_10664 [Trichinella pseudospiralis]
MLDLSSGCTVLLLRVYCRYTVNAPPVSRNGITLATSLMSRSLHTNSTFSSHSTIDCWGNPSNSGINRKSSDLSTPSRPPIAAITCSKFPHLSGTESKVQNRFLGKHFIRSSKDYTNVSANKRKRAHARS